MFGRGTWKVGSSGVHIVSQGTAPKQGVVPARRKFIIGPCDIPVVVGWDRTAEAEPYKVEQVTLTEVIRFRKRVEVLQHDRVDSKTEGIHRLNLGRSQCGNKDRKSTRLNSSHLGISYAVFCLKKK